MSIFMTNGVTRTALLMALAVGLVGSIGKLNGKPAYNTSNTASTNDVKRAVIIEGKPILCNVYRVPGAGLCAELPNGEKSYGFKFASELVSSRNPGNIPYRVSTKTQ